MPLRVMRQQLVPSAGNTPMTIQEMYEKRNAAIAEARKVVDKADSEKRSMNAEEKQAYDKAMKDQGDLHTQIKAAEAEVEQRKVLEDAEREMRASAGRRVPATDPNQEQRNAKPFSIELRSASHGRSSQVIELNPEQPEYARTTDKYNGAFRSWLRDPKGFEMRGGMTEFRNAASLANDVLADGGYLHAPIQFNAMLIK